MLKMYFLFFVPLVFGLQNSLGTWSTQSLQPAARSKHGQIKITDDTMFIYGGRNPVGDMLGDAWLYNASNNGFSQIKFQGSAVPARSYATVASVFTSRSSTKNGVRYPSIFIWGGLATERPVNKVLQDMYEVNPVNWFAAPITSDLPGRMKHSTVVLGSRMLILFGVSRGIRNDVWEYDAEARQWSELVPVNTPPQARFGTCCDALSSTSVICFGGTKIDTLDSSEVLKFDRLTKQWETLFPTNPGQGVPPSRRQLACFYTPEKNTFTISFGWSGSKSQQYGDMWDFDVGVRTWTQINPPITGDFELIESCTWTRLGGSLTYLFGGWGENITINPLWQHDIYSRKLTQLMKKDERPSSRALHCVANIGETIYVMLGSSAGNVLSDIWKYDTVLQHWESIRAPFPKTLFGMTCNPYSTKIFVFGGKSSFNMKTNDYSSDLYLLDQNQAVTLVTLSGGDKPQERYMHAAAMYYGSLFVMGGINNGAATLDDLWAFDVHLSRWSQIQYSPGDSNPVPPLIKHNLMSIGNRQLLLANGFDLNYNYGDRWIMTPQNSSDGTVSFIVTKSKLNFDDDMSLSDVIRSRSVSMSGFNNTKVSFIGGVMDEDSAVERSSFTTFDLTTLMNRMVTPMPVTVTEASGAFVGRTIYIFGGRLISGGVVTEEEQSYLQMFTFDKNSICQDFNDVSGCQTCPPGFIPPSCEPCNLNTYFDEDLGKCVECGTGRYVNFRGAVSRIGCSLDTFVPIKTTSDNPKPTSVQPKPFEEESMPWLIWIVVICIGTISCGILLFLMFGLTMLKISNRKNLIFPEMKTALEKVFKGIAEDETNVGPGELFMIFKYIADDASRPHVEEEWIEQLVMKFDENGSREIEFDEFEDMVVSVCLSVKEPRFSIDWARISDQQISMDNIPDAMRPIPKEDDEHYQRIIKAKREARGPFNFSLKTIDNFTSAHTVGELGEAMYIKATVTGGITTIAWLLGLVIIIIALAGVQYYENETEERTTMPYIALPYNVTSSIVQLEFALVGSGYSANTQPDEQLHICNSFTINYVDISSTKKGEPPKRHCTFGNGVINFTWVCYNCYLGTDQSSLSIQSSDDRSYASTISLTIRTFSGIGAQVNSQRSVTSFFANANDGTVFRGLAKATEFQVQAFPTVFGSKTDIDNQAYDKIQTGYHVAITRVSPGDTTSLSSFLNTNGIRINVVIQVQGASTLLVTRREKKDLLTFFTGLGGAVSGFIGFLTAVMRMADKQLMNFYTKMKKRKQQKEILELQRAGSSPRKDGGPKTAFDIAPSAKFIPPNLPPTYALALDIMKAGLSFKSSEAIVKAIMDTKDMDKERLVQTEPSSPSSKSPKAKFDKA